MSNIPKVLCRDIHGNAHLVERHKLIRRNASYAIIVHEQKILLVCDRSGSHRWDFPGGGVDPGENSTEALHREVLEETGLHVIGKPILTCNFIEYFFDIEGQVGWESHRSFYKTQVGGITNTTGNHDDIVDIRFFALPLDKDLHVAPVVQLLMSELPRQEQP